MARTVTAAPKKELNEVHLIRGVASLMVCLFHIIVGDDKVFPAGNLLKQLFAYGYLGVVAFFILSGYIICYSFPKNFGYRDMGTFMAKRITRIEPPYILSIVLVVALNVVSYRITGKSSNVTALGLAGHLAYANNFTGTPYVNVVYWTLGIEFQFYVLIGLLFPLLKLSRAAMVGLMAAFIAVSYLPQPEHMKLLYPYLTYFAIGISIFSYKHGNGLKQPLMFLITGVSLFTIYWIHGLPACVVSVCTAAVLLYWRHVNPVIKFFSLISFSLYLLHVPIGGKVINLGFRFIHSEAGHYGLVLLALAASIGSAYLFYLLIEKPAVKWSKKILYAAQQKAPAVQEPLEGRRRIAKILRYKKPV